MNLSLRSTLSLCCCLGLALAGCKGSGDSAGHGPPPLAGPSHGPLDAYDSYDSPPLMDYQDPPLRPVPPKTREGRPLPPPAPPVPELKGDDRERPSLPVPSARRDRERGLRPVSAEEAAAAQWSGRAPIRAAVVSNQGIDGIRPSKHNPVTLDGIEFVEVLDETPASDGLSPIGAKASASNPFVRPTRRDAYPDANAAPPLPVLVTAPRG